MRIQHLLLGFVLLGCQAQASIDAKATADAPTSSRKVPAGPTPKVEGNHEWIELAEGTFQGDLIVTGNHNRVTGAGSGKTIIDGQLVMKGNHNAVSGVTVMKGGVVEGNHNDASGAEVQGGVKLAGNQNEK